MNTTNNLIGKKVKGFKFDNDKYDYGYSDKMDKHIGVVGIIKEYTQVFNAYLVDFENEDWYYPAELIEQHLVKENPLEDLPIIGDGVLMEVSNKEENIWHLAEVYCKINESYLAKLKIDNFISEWDFVRPITKKQK
jgi:hypothetical protein